jgi:hypothetical protein
MTQSQLTDSSTLLANNLLKRKYGSSNSITALGAIDKYITHKKRTKISTLSSYYTPDYWTHPDDFAKTHSPNVLKRSPNRDPHTTTKKPRLRQGDLTHFLAATTFHPTSISLTGSSTKSQLPVHNPCTNKQKIDTLRPLTAADIDSIASTPLDSSNISQNDYFTIQLGLKTKASKRKRKIKKNSKQFSLSASQDVLSTSLTRGQL